MNGDSVGTSRSKGFDALKSRYSCLYEPSSPPARPISSQRRRYLTSLFVFGNREVEQPQSPRPSSLNNRADYISANPEVYDKICKAFKLLNLRDDCIIIQFWSPYTVGKHKFLQTVDQPFCLGIDNEGLHNYRRESESTRFSVDEECKEEDLTSVLRVFRRQLPEWTSDVTNYLSKIHPQQDCAIRWNLHGYLVLPVFDSLTELCVGVLESITSYKYPDCAYEVQEIHRCLKAANLTSPQAFSCPISYVDYTNRQHELHEIFKILKDVCNTYKLPLAQTWAVSSGSSFVATGRNIEMTCSSFDCRCIGKVCMSTTALPFYVHDLRFWDFREACGEHHLLKSRGVVGRALSSHGSCFCANVTKLEEDEYSLVHYARISGLTSCFAIYVCSNEHDDGYVLEFFLPVDMKQGADLQKLVQMLKMHLKLSFFEFGGLLSTKVIEIPIEGSQLLFGTHAQEKNYFDSSYLKNSSSTITNSNTKEMAVDNVVKKKIDLVTVEKGCNSGETRASTKKTRKRKRNSFTRETIHQYLGKPIGEASKSLGVSRSTLQRVCRELQISSWPLPHRNKKYAHFGISVIVFLLVRVKRWSCSSNRHGFSARWWVCGRHNSFRSKPNPSAIQGETIRGQLYVAQPLKQSDDSIKTLTPFFKSPQTCFGIYEATHLLLGLKRWRKKTARPHRILSCTFDTFYASPKKNVVNVSDTIMVTVKVTYKDDMIKFQFPLASGLLELKNQVAQRFELNNMKFHLKYRDEDDDLILVACDSDFRNLMPFSTTSVSKNTVRLIVTVVD